MPRRPPYPPRHPLYAMIPVNLAASLADAASGACVPQRAIVEAALRHYFLPGPGHWIETNSDGTPFAGPPAPPRAIDVSDVADEAMRAFDASADEAGRAIPTTALDPIDDDRHDGSAQ